MNRLLLSLILLALAPVEMKGAQDSTIAPANRAAANRAAIKAATAQRRPEERGQRSRSISGRVVNDSGQPIPSAAIFVGGVGTAATRSRSTGTDSEGRFVVDDLAAGVYRIVPYVPGYVISADAEEPRYYRVGDSVTIKMTKGGVITGAVTAASGEPVTAITVRTFRVRELNGRPARLAGGESERQTDDRGIYRLYGLQPGIYLVAARGQSGFSSGGPSNAYEDNAPTYYPSATRDTAAEVTVSAGDEATGVDIRYRGERGHAVSGTVSGSVGPDTVRNGINIMLTSASGKVIEANTYLQRNRSFAIYGVPDGEYDLSAQRGFGSVEGAASQPRRVVVKGADVTGVELALNPLGSISGRLVVEVLQDAERKTECIDKRSASIDEAIIIPRPDTNDDKEQAYYPWRFGSASTPDNKGDFALYNLRAGRFRLDAGLPNENWYLRAVALPGPTPGRQTDVSRNGITLKSGERVTGVLLTVAEGAAVLSGRIAPATEATPLPARLRLHLIPAEREQAENLLRYYETSLQPDGSFVAANIAPGRYFVIARPAAEDRSGDSFIRPVSWDLASRAALRRDAEALGVAVELSPCQRTADYTVGYAPPASARPKQKAN